MNDKTGVDFSNMNLQDYGPTDRRHPFGDILDVLGPMDFVEPVSQKEAERYRGRLPDGLLDFWVKNGRGALLQGYAWLCDPELLRPVLETVFEGDPEYSADQFDCYLYDYEGRISAWSSDLHACRIDLTGFDDAQVSIDGSAPKLDVNGTPMSDDLAVGHTIRFSGYSLGHQMDEEYTDYHLFTSASNRLGRLEPGEIFGFFPSRQMGGEGYPEDMRKVKIVEHLLFHAQLERATLIGWESIPGGGGLRRPLPIRKLGSQSD